MSNLKSEAQVIRATELAQRLNLSQGRISQLVAEGRLDGCYTGQGRDRRFDLDKVAETLGRRLHPGQLMGNGAATRRALAELRDERPEPAPVAPAERSGTELRATDPDRYELARTQKAEEEARKLRRQNAEAEGTMVLASEVEQRVHRMIAQEIAEFETVLRDGARAVADALGVDYRVTRQKLVETWRSHRGRRSDTLSGQSTAAVLSDAEKAEDI